MVATRDDTGWGTPRSKLLVEEILHGWLNWPQDCPVLIFDAEMHYGISRVRGKVIGVEGRTFVF
jgi:hypothetical protein